MSIIRVIMVNVVVFKEKSDSVREKWKNHHTTWFNLKKKEKQQRKNKKPKKGLRNMKWNVH